MNINFENLYAIIQKNERNIIGLMSGTSLDGLDVALCHIKGSGLNTKLTLSHFKTVSYNDDFKNEIRSVFSKEVVNLQKLCLLNEWVAKQHASMVNHCLREWEIPTTEIDLIASHGQTIYHAPLSLHGLEKFGNGSLQIGDGDHLSVETGIITLSDFRQKHIAAGGEGAPLAAYGDYLVFKEDDTDVILLNIGGIANFSFLPANLQENSMFSSDVGPGNTMMDGWMQKNFPGQSYDQDGEVAKEGTVNEVLLKELLQHDFFNEPFPKTTGPELFNGRYLEDAAQRGSASLARVAEVMATLNRFTAITIADAINAVVKNNHCKIYVSGGGMHNPVLMEYLRENIKGAVFHATEEKNINPDAKEAILFAILANEALCGSAEVFPSALKNFPAVSMGKLSFPF
ncbi:MAG: anhydro-N-acetylmuramic acid kinase [Gloeobacteraceae cyanobacterium ES-bin-316]|nr:anhydro-N-acetylmuramic acid kinase [Ferruginibacter sp.]